MKRNYHERECVTAIPRNFEFLNLRFDQCFEQNVPFFFKQWGGFNKKKHGRLLQVRTYDEMPVLMTGSIPSSAQRRVIKLEIEAMAAQMRVN